MIKKILYTILSLHISLFSFEFKVASYNVENLFDMHNDGTEYSQYMPNTKSWNKKAYFSKLHNVSKVIKHLDAHIIGLQEIESKRAFRDLRKKLKKYPYGVFLKNKTSSVGVALLSKYKILKSEKIISNKYTPHSRHILKVTLDINNKNLIIYVNHWRSKKASESKRIIYATALKNDIEKLSKNTNYIILGDLNSNYNEYITFKHDKKLNNTYGITGINQILNTTINGNYVQPNLSKYKQIVHYNLWLDIANKYRFSSLYKKNKNTPDHIIISSNMINGKSIYYKANSFNVFKPKYLFQNKRINRWNKSKYKGYSDHLPIYATFTSTKSGHISKKSISNKNSISYLYDINKLDEPLRYKNIKVIYKYDNSAVITLDNDKSVLIYKVASKLKVKNTYDITIERLDTYFGLKEVVEISNIKKKETNTFNPKDYYLDARKIDIFNSKHQNNMIRNLRGTYKKNYLYFRNDKTHKVKLFFDKKIKKPKQNTKITITSGHLSIYKSQVQIAIHKQSDYK